MKQWLTTLLTATGTLGGWEALKYMLNRKTNHRIEEAKADESEFTVLKETNIFLQQQLKYKEERFAEQTALVRQQNSEILALTSEIAMLRAERALKLCERRNCPTREPQSGY